MPSYPPISPVTTSYFTMWAFFDVLFGQSHETIGYIAAAPLFLCGSAALCVKKGTDKLSK